jgi:uncharacterized protein YjbI with pentapeptide repeats
MTRASFSLANLTGADLTDAALFDTTFTGANMSDAILTGAKGYAPLPV